MNVSEPAEHVGPRHLNLVKYEPTIVLAVVAQFGANIADFNAFERHVSLKVTNLDQEALWTIIFSSDDAAGEESRMVGP